jgi:hypothetical protein
MAQNPEDLTRAGFFYTGEGDKCTTFCCGGNVFQWNHFDDPLKEHRKHFPKCMLPFLLEK